jgi:hypothetical protein
MKKWTRIIPLGQMLRVKKKSDVGMRQTGPKPVQVVLYQGVTQQSDKKLEVSTQRFDSVEL